MEGGHTALTDVDIPEALSINVAPGVLIAGGGQRVLIEKGVVQNVRGGQDHQNKRKDLELLTIEENHGVLNVRGDLVVLQDIQVDTRNETGDQDRLIGEVMKKSQTNLQVSFINSGKN